MEDGALIRYRRFRNDDPPKLARLWNECDLPRGANVAPETLTLERFLFSRPYFNADAVQVAEEEEGSVVGFSLTGFGPNADRSALDVRKGVIAMLLVHPDYRYKGVGSALLKRAEEYLRGRGAEEIFAGPLPPNNPYGFGLYGGANSPGFLLTDIEAEPFFNRHHYHGFETVAVLQRRLNAPVVVNDPRFNQIRRQFDVQSILFAPLADWWQDCVFGWADPREFRLTDKKTRKPAGRAVVWEMDGYNRKWGLVPAGIVELHIREDLRRRGLGKFLLTHILKQLQSEMIAVVELQVPERDTAAVGLALSVGFSTIDVGRAYRLDDTEESIRVDSLDDLDD